ncbi:hypothetical protein FRB90_004409, partial [Tulasnella sp. 427]
MRDVYMGMVGDPELGGWTVRKVWVDRTNKGNIAHPPSQLNLGLWPFISHEHRRRLRGYIAPIIIITTIARLHSSLYESAMAQWKSGAAADLSAEVTPPQLIPLYLQHISEQLGRPLPPKDSEEYYSLLADLDIATYQKYWTKSLNLLPPADHRKLIDLEKFLTSCPDLPPPTINPYENLQQYASKARLPPMPWSTDLGKLSEPGTASESGVPRPTATHTVGSSAVVPPDSARRLRSVRRVPTQQFFQRVLAFSKSHLPSSQ